MQRVCKWKLSSKQRKNKVIIKQRGEEKQRSLISKIFWDICGFFGGGSVIFPHDCAFKWQVKVLYWYLKVSGEQLQSGMMQEKHLKSGENINFGGLLFRDLSSKIDQSCSPLCTVLPKYGQRTWSARRHYSLIHSSFAEWVTRNHEKLPSLISFCVFSINQWIRSCFLSHFLPNLSIRTFVLGGEYTRRDIFRKRDKGQCKFNSLRQAIIPLGVSVSCNPKHLGRKNALMFFLLLIKAWFHKSKHYQQWWLHCQYQLPWQQYFKTN